MSLFDPYQHFGFLTNRLAKLINSKAEKLIAQQGFKFPPSCIGILAELWTTDGIHQKDLSISLYKNKSSINKMLLALERDQMIRRQDDEQDKRYKRIFLTKKGKEFKKHIQKKSQTMDLKLQQYYAATEIQQTKEFLHTFMKILSQETH